MDLAMGGIVLQAISLLQSVGSGRVQGQMANDLRMLREILERQFGVSDPAYLFAPEPLWTDTYPALPSSTILIVTGAHLYSEMFDRAAAYAIKLSLDRIRPGTAQAPSSVVVSDLWVGREPSLAAGRLSISVGGPAVNTFSADIARDGKLVHRDAAWQVISAANRIAVFGDEATDTLHACQYFMKHELDRVVASARSRI